MAPGRLASRNSTPLDSTELFFITTLHRPRRKHSLFCWEGVFTAALHSKGSYLIVTCVFVAARMCLQSRCLATNVYSDFTIPAFGRHVTIFFTCIINEIPGRINYDYVVCHFCSVIRFQIIYPSS
jgi:hypothetical protein